MSKKRRRKPAERIDVTEAESVQVAMAVNRAHTLLTSRQHAERIAKQITIMFQEVAQAGDLMQARANEVGRHDLDLMAQEMNQVPKTGPELIGSAESVADDGRTIDWYGLHFVGGRFVCGLLAELCIHIASMAELEPDFDSPTWAGLRGERPWWEWCALAVDVYSAVFEDALELPPVLIGIRDVPPLDTD